MRRPFSVAVVLLVREDNKSLNKTIFLTYDNFGNILSERRTAYTMKNLEKITEFADEICYHYDEKYPGRLQRYGDPAIEYNDVSYNTNGCLYFTTAGI